MPKQKCSLKMYSYFLMANQNRYSGVELSKVAPKNISHDTVSRWLSDSHFTPSDLWSDVKRFIDVKTGYLIGDDTLLEKKYSQFNELAKVQYSGNLHHVTNGISLVNLLWTGDQGEEYVPVDYRVYQKENDDRTKNDHFRDMLKRAKKRGFKPIYVLIDAWYASRDNLKLIAKELKWKFVCNLASNRQVSVTKNIYVSLADLDLAEKQVKRVWLKEYGFVLVSKTVDKKGDVRYLATNDLTLTDYDDLIDHHEQRWQIEEFHRGIKQTTGLAKCYSTLAASQKTHIFASMTAFVRLEKNRLKEKISWYEQKAMIGRSATLNYLGKNA
jgi:putative transposase